MNHINSVVATITALTLSEKPTTYAQLPLTAQLRVLNSRVYAAKSQISWWTPHIDDTEKTDQFRKRAIAEVNSYQKAINSMLPVIKAAAHYRDDGSTAEIKFDTGYVDELGIPSGDEEYSQVAVTGHPHAWVMAGLVTNLGLDFDKVTADANAKLIIPDVQKVYDKAVGTYLAQLILIEHGLYQPPKSERGNQWQIDTIELATASLKLFQTKDAKSKRFLHQQLLAFCKPFEGFPLKVTSYVDGEAVVKSYSYKDIVVLWKQLEAIDAEEAEAEAEAKADEESKAEAKSLKADIKAAVRQAIFTTSVMAELVKATQQMKDAGLADDIISAVMKPIAEQLAAA